jgi:tripartite-type tricarboxylate transporter receptor subunit TctC
MRFRRSQDFPMRAILTLLLVLVAGAASAQSYPSRPVRIVIGVTAGGLSDTLARGLANELSKLWGQSVLVENRPGASDVVAAEVVAKSAPDGYTLYQTNANVTMVNQFLRHNLPFNVEKDFVPVVGLVQTSDVLLVRPALPARNVQELVALARSKPGALNYGTFGMGSAAHLDAEKFSVAAGVRMLHVPYKGGAEVMQALLSGDVDLAFTGLTAAVPLIKSGKLRAIAWGAEQRSPALPDVPTLREAGYDFETGGWLGMLVPSGTPAAIIDKVSTDCGRVLDLPAFRDKYVLAAGLEPMNMPARPFAEYLKASRDKYAKLFKTVDIKLD